MTETTLLKQILERLTSIEEKLDMIANPLAHVTIKEKGAAIRRAMESGDKKLLKETIKQINGR